MPLYPLALLASFALGVLLVEVEGEAEGSLERFGDEREARLRERMDVMDVVMLVDKREKRGLSAGAQAQS